jgi:hypothetical protein
MSLITHIDGVPLYTTLAEAELWASQYNLPGYHTHNVLGIVGYMGGASHEDITTAMQLGVINVLDPELLKEANLNSLPLTPRSTTSSSGGGGGY